ncbi:hypothetical protein LTR37_008026 [Vermiconidia calcicola]|uniref:Uncharacterized protein n=1 Tax=Vermiconidia calcicola TaxID=1690605 RepID=A0ACC3NC93_9PEZI|nr:hypothetical protein LTR37_008026 [Vermiconidia calcicola]
MEKNASTQQSPLLKLPAELRDLIHAYTLVVDDIVAITASGIREPPLLLACRQIRQEAGKLFYGENEFLFCMLDCDSDIVVQGESWARAVEEEYGCLLRLRAGIPATNAPSDWKKLLEWIRRYREGTVNLKFVPPSMMPQGTPTCMLVIGGLFKIAEMEEQSWASVEGVLEEQHQILARLDSTWA